MAMTYSATYNRCFPDTMGGWFVNVLSVYKSKNTLLTMMILYREFPSCIQWKMSFWTDKGVAISLDLKPESVSWSWVQAAALYIW